MSHVFQINRLCTYPFKFTFIFTNKCKDGKMSHKTDLAVEQAVEPICIVINDSSLESMYVTLYFFSRL